MIIMINFLQNNLDICLHLERKSHKSDVKKKNSN